MTRICQKPIVHKTCNVRHLHYHLMYHARCQKFHMQQGIRAAKSMEEHPIKQTDNHILGTAPQAFIPRSPAAWTLAALLATP